MLESFGQNQNQEQTSREAAFLELKKREQELERLNEIETNLAISFFPSEAEIDDCLMKWESSPLSDMFRRIAENEAIKNRLLSTDARTFDDAYYEVMEKLKENYNDENAN